MLDEWVAHSCDEGAVPGGRGGQGLILAGGPGWLLEEKREEFDPGLKGESNPEQGRAEEHIKGLRRRQRRYPGREWPEARGTTGQFCLHFTPLLRHTPGI